MAGRVAEVWLFPVKSMAGTAVATAHLDRGGLVGDRAWAVVDEAGDPVTAAHEPRLRQVRAWLVSGELRLDVPGARPGLRPEAAAAAMSAWLGRPLRLAHREGSGFVDVAPVHVVSRTSIAQAAEHAESCAACDVANPRANLVIELDASRGTELDASRGTERDWPGATVTVGGARLRLVGPPDHCLGAYAEVALPGRVAVGDCVLLG